MGNQTMVPSQIQSAESYFLDLKNYAQFKSSLGSTAFMKTAKVCLIEDPLISLPDLQQQQLNSTLNSNQNIVSSSNTTNNLNNIQTNNNAINTTQQNKLNQLQLLKQRVQELREQQQQVVVKIFPKYDLTIRLDLYSKRVREIKNIIYLTYGLDTNCLPFSEMIVTDRAAFLFRQFVKYNLYDRLSTRPFLTHIEKKWIAFQLICAVNEIHSLQIVHGDIKTENVLVNSFLWVSLADFASYKPVYLSKNHPSADFNYYFDISRRRTCYLAPERLDSNRDSLNRMNQMSPPHLPQDHDNGIDELVPPDPNDFQASMDIFSLGCVLAELFMERPLFDFAHLLAYRDRKYDPTNELVNEIRDKSILEMIFTMLSLDSNARLSANEYLQEQNDKSFPSYFVYLKNYIKGFISVKLTPDEIVIRLKNDLPLLLKNFKLNLNEIIPDNTDQNVFTEIKLTNSQHDSSTDTNDAFLILLSLLLSCIRKLKFNENKLIAVDLLANFSKYLDDSVILDRILPYYICLVEETNQSPIVKSHVIYALNDCLSNIYNLDLQNMNIFPEIIFVILETLSKDESFLVRSSVAKTISNFALTSLRYLDTSFLIKRTMQNNDSANDDNQNHDSKSRTAIKIDKTTNENKFGSYDKEHELYQNRITEIVMHLITDISQTSNSSNAVKETLIRSDISKLCSFFSRQKTSEFLLPHMITILNEKTDWSVRAAFFDALCPVLSCIGWESVEIVKSLLEQGLRDSEEFVIHRTLITLSKMVEIGLLDRQQICFFLSNHITALLCHPSLWIRHGAVNFITVVCKQQNQKSKYKKELTLSNALTRQLPDDLSQNNGLNTADVLCSVAPLLSKFLDRKDLINYDKEEILFHCLKKPIKRAVYDCISQDGRSDQLFIYLNQRSEIRCLTNQKFLPGYLDCSDPNVQQFFEKLCKLGFVEEDEDKLLHMKDFMDKTRISRLSSSLHNADMSLSNNSNTTSVLNPSWINNNNSKENYILKDGFITIMKDKFQRFNAELLNGRKMPGADSLSKMESSDKLNSKLNSPLNQTSQMKIDESTNTLVQATTNENTLNSEWKMMFSESKTLTRNKSGLKQSESSHHINRQQQHHNQTNQYLQSHNSFKNCIVEVEKYLDRCKYLYEDQKVKRQRVDRTKETINSSISSNSVCLNTANKWKPKGYLLVHSNEHTKEISKLSRNFDSSYFSTCSYSEQSVKIWTTDNLLDGKSGFFKSIFTYDKHTARNTTNQDSVSIRPCCTTFYDKNSLAILCEDFKFHVIDFNSNRTQYHLYTHDKLFKPAICNCNKQTPVIRNQFDNTTFYYLNRSYKNNNLNSAKNITKSCCYCNHNYPIEMIYLDDSSPTWPIAATNPNDYFRSGTIASNSKGLFCYSTSIGDFSCIDLRTRSKAFEIKRDLRKGYITTMITDPWYTWLAMGTSYGNIELYDFRFMLPIQTFEHRSKTAVAKLCNHPNLNNRLIASYQGNNEISIWNMDSSQNSSSTGLAKLNTVDPEFVFWGVQSVPPLCQNKISSYYMTGLIGVFAGDDNGLICASTDMKIRYIDLNKGNRDSFIISTPFNFQSGSKSNETNLRNSPNSTNANPSSSNNFEFANSLSSNNVTYELRQIEGNQVLLELDQYSSGQQFNLNNSNNTPQSYSYNSPALTHQSYFTHHQDAITDLTVCYNQFNSKNPPLIITSARDGALKIWR